MCETWIVLCANALYETLDYSLNIINVGQYIRILSHVLLLLTYVMWGYNDISTTNI